MIFASLGPLGGPLGALLGLLWGLLGRLGGILGHLGSFGGLPGPSWKPSWASWTPWRAPGTCLGADRASGRGGGARSWTRPGGGEPLRRLQKPYQTALGILARLNVPGGTVADLGRLGTSFQRLGACWTVSGASRGFLSALLERSGGASRAAPGPLSGYF